jgi:hypothetical protein
MPEVLTAPRVMTGDQTVIDGAVVIGDRTVDWAGPAGTLPAEYAALPQTDYPDSTIMRTDAGIDNTPRLTSTRSPERPGDGRLRSLRAGDGRLRSLRAGDARRTRMQVQDRRRGRPRSRPEI